MKTYKKLYPKISEFENLHSAYLKARRNKRYKRDVLEFSANLEENLLTLQRELREKRYLTGEYKSFYAYEPKKRLVRTLPFRDRVAQHAICNIVEPIFEKRFIYDSYACRVEKGTHKGADRLTYFLRKMRRKTNKLYCLKADIKGYFASVNHEVLLGLLGKKLGCEDTMELLKEIVYGTGDSTGIPIGNLSSQLFANIYLNELDYFVKHSLGCRYYIRYMDDFVILDRDKKKLRLIQDEIAGFVDSALSLKLNKKTAIFPITRGIDFLGYRVWATHRLLRKRVITQLKRKLKEFQLGYKRGRISLGKIKSSLGSYLGHMKYADSYNLRCKLLGSFVLIKGVEKRIQK